MWTIENMSPTFLQAQQAETGCSEQAWYVWAEVPQAGCGLRLVMLASRPEVSTAFVFWLFEWSEALCGHWICLLCLLLGMVG